MYSCSFVLRQFRWLPAVLICLLTAANCVQAQQGRDILGGLLQDLLRSTIDRDNQPPPRPYDDSRLLLPGERSAQQQAPKTVPPVVLQASRQYRAFSQEAMRLTRLLRRDARRVPGVSSHLNEVLQIQARAQLMGDRFSTPQKKDFILDNIRALDRDWRTTSYHLRQLSIGDPCVQSITRLDALNKECCDLFDLQPQLNRRELVRLADALAAELNHLVRDVEYELQTRAGSRRLLMQLRRSEAKAKLFGDSVADGDRLEIVVAEFQDFYQNWLQLSHELEDFNDRHVDRTVEQIHAINRSLHDFLRIPLGIDRTHINHLATNLRTRIKSLNDAFSLSMLTELPNAAAVLRSAQTLTNEVAGLCECITNTAPEEELIEHCQTMDAAWREFGTYTQPVSSPRIRTLRQEISDNIYAMREALGVRLVFDRREVLRAIAELEGIAEQAQYHIGQWQRRPGAQMDAQLIRLAQDMINEVHALHEGCTNNLSRDELTRDCRRLSRNWAKLRPMLMACDTVDQRTLHRISDEATAKLIHLQTMLEP